MVLLLCFQIIFQYSSTHRSHMQDYILMEFTDVGGCSIMKYKVKKQ